ncbi:MAG: type II secretion system F family protein [Pseudobdellovibrio sp.]
MKLLELSLFYNNLSEMLQAGVSMDSTFESILKSSRNPEVQPKINYIIRQIKKGEPLTPALKNSKLVPVFDIPVINAGEKSGNLTHVFNILSKNYQQAADSEKNIRSGLMTPFFTFGAALFLPSFPDLFTGKITLAHYLLKNLGILGIILAAAYVGYQHFMNSYYDLDKARLRHKILSALPYFDQLSRKISLEKFCSSLALMLEAGIPVFEALHLAGQTSADDQLDIAAQRIVVELKKGRNLSSAFQNEKIFSDDIVSSVALGAESGKLPHFLGRSAQQLKTQVSQSIEKVSKAIPKIIYWAVMLYVAWTIVQFYTARINTLNEIIDSSN